MARGLTVQATLKYRGHKAEDFEQISAWSLPDLHQLEQEYVDPLTANGFDERQGLAIGEMFQASARKRAIQ